MITKNDTVLLENKKEEQKPSSLQKLGTFILQKGHNIYEYNFNQAKLCLAKIEKSNTYCEGENNANKLFQKENCIYFTALNNTNAERKLTKWLQSKKTTIENRL